MPVVDQIVTGVTLGGLLSVGALVLVFGYNTAVSLSRGRDIEETVPSAGRRTWAVFMGALGALAVVVSQFGGVVEAFTGFLASNPVAASNAFALVMGWLGITGRISTLAFAVAVGLFAFVTIVAREVRG